MNDFDAGSDDDDEALRREIRKEHAEIELELELEHKRLDLAVDVLAWYLVPEGEGVRLERWPEEALFLEEPLFIWLALRDRTFRSQANFEIMYSIREFGIDWRQDDLIELLERLLNASEPPKRRKGGDNLARDLLIVATAELGADWAAWDNNHLRSDRGYSGASIARSLCDRLNTHPALEKFSDAVPSEGTIRAVWDKRRAWIDKIGIQKEFLDGFLVSSATHSIY
jgi:hypothetical protein